MTLPLPALDRTLAPACFVDEEKHIEYIHQKSNRLSCCLHLYCFAFICSYIIPVIFYFAGSVCSQIQWWDGSWFSAHYFVRIFYVGGSHDLYPTLNSRIYGARNRSEVYRFTDIRSWNQWQLLSSLPPFQTQRQQREGL